MTFARAFANGQAPVGFRHVLVQLSVRCEDVYFRKSVTMADFIVHRVVRPASPSPRRCKVLSMRGSPMIGICRSVEGQRDHFPDESPHSAHSSGCTVTAVVSQHCFRPGRGDGNDPEPSARDKL